MKKSVRKTSSTGITSTGRASASSSTSRASASTSSAPQPTPPPSSSIPKKIIILVRHGQSLGQSAKEDGKNRKTDKSLVDAKLSNKGLRQASLLSTTMDISRVQLIVSSPLTRAFQTAVIAFKNRDVESTKMMVHYHIREIGSRIPENQPRPISAVLRDVRSNPQTNFDHVSSIDTDSLRPEDWPSIGAKNDKADELSNFKSWLYNDRDEDVIAVVCHHNVIVALLGAQVRRVVNAVPIHCELDEGGRLRVVKESEQQGRGD